MQNSTGVEPRVLVGETAGLVFQIRRIGAAAELIERKHSAACGAQAQRAAYMVDSDKEYLMILTAVRHVDNQWKNGTQLGSLTVRRKQGSLSLLSLNLFEMGAELKPIPFGDRPMDNGDASQAD